MVFGARGGVIGRASGLWFGAMVAAGVMCPAVVLEMSESAVFADAPEDYQLESMGGVFMMEDATLGGGPVTPAHLRQYAEVLGLSEHQLEIARELQRELFAEYRRAWTLFREATMDLQYEQQLAAEGVEPNWMEQQQIVREQSREFAAIRERLTNRFDEDVRLLLTGDQAARWEEYERTRRRVTTLSRFGVFPDERLDLLRIARDLDGPEALSAEAASLLEQYAIELDSAIRRRNEVSEPLRDDVEAFVGAQHRLWTQDGGVVDWEAGQAEIEDKRSVAIKSALAYRDASRRVRDVNRRYIELIAAALGPAAGETFRGVIAEEREVGGSRPNLFVGGSKAQMALLFVDEFDALSAAVSIQGRMMSVMTGSRDEPPNVRVPGLTTEQIEKLQALRDEFERRRAAIMAKHDAGGDDEEPPTLVIRYQGGSVALVKLNEQGLPITSPWEAMQGTGDSEEMKARQRELIELDREIIHQLRGVLTLDQRSVLAHLMM